MGQCDCSVVPSREKPSSDEEGGTAYAVTEGEKTTPQSR